MGIPADIHSCGLGYPLPSDALGALPQLFLHGSLTGNSGRPVTSFSPFSAELARAVALPGVAVDFRPDYAGL